MVEGEGTGGGEVEGGVMVEEEGVSTLSPQPALDLYPSCRCVAGGGTLSAKSNVCVCLCVCERERENMVFVCLRLCPCPCPCVCVCV